MQIDGETDAVYVPVGRLRFAEILIPCIVAARAVPVRFCGVRTGHSLVMFVTRIEALALGHGGRVLSV